MSPTLHPLPSTTEFVASVEDSATISAASTWAGFKASMAPLMPMLRSSRVVMLLALSRTSPVSMSMITASVYVPPVSIPKPNLMRPLPVCLAAYPVGH